jgi:rhomboid family GlyGly-CTERM serine protease
MLTRISILQANCRQCRESRGGVTLGAIMNGHNAIVTRWWPPLLVAGVCIAAQALGWTGALRFERGLIAAEPWRLLSGHFVHLGWMHLALNLGGLALMWALFGRGLRPAAWAGVLLLCALAVGGGLYVFDTALAWYVGLSGVLHGLLVLGAWAARRAEARTALVVLLAIAAKLAWEQFTGADTGTAQLVGGDVVVNAHLYGALGGLAAAALLRFPPPPPK